jgi:hypothetical protein
MWLPGTDHAGIATQTVVERQLRKEKKTRHDFGRENFWKKVWEWRRRERRHHPRSSSSRTRRLVRLGPHAVHDGPALLEGGARRVRETLRQADTFTAASAW